MNPFSNQGGGGNALFRDFPAIFDLDTLTDSTLFTVPTGKCLWVDKTVVYGVSLLGVSGNFQLKVNTTIHQNTPFNTIGDVSSSNQAGYVQVTATGKRNQKINAGENLEYETTSTDGSATNFKVMVFGFLMDE